MTRSEEEAQEDFNKYLEDWRKRDRDEFRYNERKIRQFARIIALTILKMEKKRVIRVDFYYDAFRAELRQKKTQHGEPAGSS